MRVGDAAPADKSAVLLVYEGPEPEAALLPVARHPPESLVDLLPCPGHAGALAGDGEQLIKVVLTERPEDKPFGLQHTHGDTVRSGCPPRLNPTGCRITGQSLAEDRVHCPTAEDVGAGVPQLASARVPSGNARSS